jgi:hypothetical protein
MAAGRFPLHAVGTFAREANYNNEGLWENSFIVSRINRVLVHTIGLRQHCGLQAVFAGLAVSVFPRCALDARLRCLRQHLHVAGDQMTVELAIFPELALHPLPISRVAWGR